MAITISIYNQVREDILSSAIDLDGDTIKLGLLNNSATFTATHTVWSDISTNEIANGSGYTTGGATLAGKVVNHTSGTAKWDADDVTWTASGGPITAYKGALYSTTLSNRLIAFIDFDGVQTAGDGTQFIVRWNASGIFTLS